LLERTDNALVTLVVAEENCFCLKLSKLS